MSEKIKEMENVSSQNKNEDNQSLEDTLKKIKPYLKILLDKKKKFLIFNGLIAVLAIVGLLLFAKPYYTSSIVFLPSYGNQSSSLSSLSNLASLAGISVGDVTPNQIYEQIIKSEKVIGGIIYNNYLTEEFEDSVNLIEYFELESSDDDMPINLQEREKFLKLHKNLIDDRIVTDLDRVTTVLTVTVTMPESFLSAEVANVLAKTLNNYITQDRQSYAREQSEYLFNRIKQVRDTLNFNEDKLKEFTENNRDISNSPTLILEQNRLMRKTEIAQSVFIELTKQYEIIKLDEVKDTPVVNVLESAKPPIKKAGPRRKLIFVGIMFFSGLLSVGYLIFGDDIKKFFKLIFN